MVERRLAGEGNAIAYALTPWGEQLRPTVDGLVRWSAPLMAKGPDGDRFRPEWLAVALPALLAGRTARRATVVAIDVGGPTILVRLTRRGVEVRITGDAGGPIGGGAAGAVDDGIEPDATITTDAATILGLAAGAVTLAQVASAIVIAGNRVAVRALFEAKAAETESRPAGAP